MAPEQQTFMHSTGALFWIPEHTHPTWHTCSHQRAVSVIPAPRVASALACMVRISHSHASMAPASISTHLSIIRDMTVGQSWPVVKEQSRSSFFGETSENVAETCAILIAKGLNHVCKGTTVGLL